MLAEWEAQLKEREARMRAAEAAAPEDEGHPQDRPD
jgi:hypothetical protein